MSSARGARWLATRMAQTEASGRVLVHDRLEYAALQWTWALHARLWPTSLPLKLKNTLKVLKQEIEV